jgi:hypothetical protein
MSQSVICRSGAQTNQVESSLTAAHVPSHACMCRLFYPPRVNSEEYALGLRALQDRKTYDRLRPISYPQTNVFVLCFLVTSPTSFENVCEAWFLEVHHHGPGIPCGMLAHTGRSKREYSCAEGASETKHDTYQMKDGKRMAKELGSRIRRMQRNGPVPLARQVVTSE